MTGKESSKTTPLVNLVWHPTKDNLFQMVECGQTQGKGFLNKGFYPEINGGYWCLHKTVGKKVVIYALFVIRKTNHKL